MVQPSFYEDEMFLSARRRAALWQIIGILSLVIAALAVLAVIALVPLKQTTPYLFMVNDETGATQRLVEVQPMDISEQAAVVQANVVRYVIDRETYDAYDNDLRIRNVLKMSDDNAALSLRQIWANPDSNAQHPDTVYGDAVRIKVAVTGVTMLSDSVAQVFLTRTRLQRNSPDIVSRSIATVGFVFDPASVKSVEQIWDNPLGFIVKDYRLDGQVGE